MLTTGERCRYETCPKTRNNPTANTVITGRYMATFKLDDRRLDAMPFKVFEKPAISALE